MWENAVTSCLPGPETSEGGWGEGRLLARPGPPGSFSGSCGSHRFNHFEVL